MRFGGAEVLRVHLGLAKQAGRHSVTRAQGASVGDLGYGPGGFRRWRAGRGRGRLGGRGPHHGRGVLDWGGGLRFARALRALVSLLSGARRRLAGGASTLEERILGPHQFPPKFLEDRLEFPTGFEALELLRGVCVNRVDAGPGRLKLGARGMLGGRGAYHVRGVEWCETAPRWGGKHA